MSKQTLEKALLEAKPEPQKAGSEFASLNEFMEHYLEDMGHKGNAVAFLSKTKGTASKLQVSWEGIPYMVGMLYRACIDGYHPLVLAGLTQQQENEFKNMVDTIRNQIALHLQRGSVKPNTPTKALYDQVIALGF